MATPEGQAAPAAANIEQIIGALIDAETAPSDDKEPKAAAEQAGTEADPNNAALEGEDASETEAEPEAESEKATAEIPLEALMEIPLDVTVKGEDGKDVVKKVTVKDLQAGYMMQEDYSRKTADVARQRDQIGQERQGFQTEREQYQQNLTMLHSLVMATAAQELSNVDWNDLAASNPGEYVRLTHRKNEIQQVLQNIHAQQQQATAKSDATKRQVSQQTTQETLAKLRAEVPGWGDDLYVKILDTAVANGVPRHVAAEWNDFGLIKLTFKAHQFDQMQAGKPLIEKKVVNVPKVIRPGASAENGAKQTASKAALKRLSASGKVDDLAAVIAAQM